MRKKYVVKCDPSALEGMVPLFCPLCDMSLCTRDDIASYRKFECCHTCEDMFCKGELAITRWKSGYRPQKEWVNERYRSLGLK